MRTPGSAEFLPRAPHLNVACCRGICLGWAEGMGHDLRGWWAGWPPSGPHLLWRLFEELIREGGELCCPNLPTHEPLCFGFFN